MLAFYPKIIISCITKTKGDLTKIMSRCPETGHVIKDGSECSMHSGIIKQIPISSPDGFARMLASRKHNQAIVHGVCEHKEARVVTKGAVNGKASASGDYPVIARTKDFITYPDRQGIILFDHDKARPGSAGSDEALASYSPEELIAVLAKVHPEIGKAAFVSTPSTSSCIFSATGEMLRGPGTGSHTYLFVKKASDIPRYLKELGKRLFLAGLGRIEVSRSGSLLERTLVDLSVGSPERLDFVAGAVCRDGLEQRLPPPVVVDGEMLDTTTLPSLTSEEEQQLKDIVAALKKQAKPHQDEVIAEYIEREAGKLATAGKITIDEARKVIESRQSHILEDSDILFFAHQDAGVTVAMVLDSGESYHGKALADPLEPDYEGGSRTKAKFFWNDGNPIIHSYAHGSAKYRFRKFKNSGTNPPSLGDIKKQFSNTIINGEELPSSKWCSTLHAARLSADEVDDAITFLASQKVGAKRALTKAYRSWVSKFEIENKKQQLDTLAGNRKLIRYSPLDLNRTVQETERAVIEVPGRWPYFNFGGMLAFATYDKPTRRSVGPENIQPPEVPVIRPYNQNNLHLRIEQSVVHFEEQGDGEQKVPFPVPTPQSVVAKILDNPSPLAPRVAGLVAHPIVTLEGEITSTEGVDENTGLLLMFGGSKFTVPGKATREQAGQAAKRIQETLFGEFNFRNEPTCAGLYIVTALAMLLTGIERKVMDQAPGFMPEASTQGSGKTALARSIHVLLTGRDMPVSTLSDNSEELQKALLATLMESPAMVCFDNVLDGSEIRDPVLAKIITAPFFKGRILGRSLEISVPTATLWCLTGNNVTLSADLVRRFVTIRLDVGVERPETRRFKHPDIVQHCLNHRSEVIHDALTIVKAYLDAGCPLNAEQLPSSGFAQWDRMVRFPLLWATGIDVIKAIENNRKQSIEHQALHGLMDSLWSFFRCELFSATQVLSLLQSRGIASLLQGEDIATIDHLSECVALLAPKALTDTRSLSWVLKKMLGRIIDGKELRYSTDAAGNRGRYLILLRDTPENIQNVHNDGTDGT